MKTISSGEYQETSAAESYHLVEIVFRSLFRMVRTKTTADDQHNNHHHHQHKGRSKKTFSQV